MLIADLFAEPIAVWKSRKMHKKNLQLYSKKYTRFVHRELKLVNTLKFAIFTGVKLTIVIALGANRQQSRQNEVMSEE